MLKLAVVVLMESLYDKVCWFFFEDVCLICSEKAEPHLFIYFWTISPRLEELFLCLNDYNTVSESKTSCPSLRLLQITDNQLHDWVEVRKFGLMYPHLKTLVLANNSVNSVGDTRETLQRLFPNLRSINLNNSGLGVILHTVHTSTCQYPLLVK